MKNITIIRHGKSGYELGLADKQRTLTERGIEKSILVANKFVDFLPKHLRILSSTATRAAMTARIFAKIFDVAETEIIFDDDLYTFDGNELANILKITNNDFANIFVFGHNEAITDFVNKFGNIYIDNVPTSGLVSIDFEVDNWTQIQKGTTIKTILTTEQ